jgi:tetratricopeptide (TPR) repeat protein
MDPANGWAQYSRAVALSRTGRTEASVQAFHDAEARFSGRDRWGESISIYGRARALDDVGRCDDAARAYEQYASFVRSVDPPSAERALAYSKTCRPARPVIGDDAMSEMVTAIVGGDFAGALGHADHVGVAARDSGWLDYNRAIALAGLSRTDEAVSAYRAAEDRFGTVAPHGREIALYGRARALADAGRCNEARHVFEDYAELVRKTAPEDVRMAARSARSCKSR